MTKSNETAPGGMNESAPGTETGAKLTPPRSGFDLEDARRSLIAKRVAAGADSEIGHRCSNLIELLENYPKAQDETQRSHIEANIRKQMADLAIRHQ